MVCVLSEMNDYLKKYEEVLNSIKEKEKMKKQKEEEFDLQIGTIDDEISLLYEKKKILEEGKKILLNTYEEESSDLIRKFDNENESKIAFITFGDFIREYSKIKNISDSDIDFNLSFITLPILGRYPDKRDLLREMNIDYFIDDVLPLHLTMKSDDTFIHSSWNVSLTEIENDGKSLFEHTESIIINDGYDRSILTVLNRPYDIIMNRSFRELTTSDKIYEGDFIEYNNAFINAIRNKEKCLKKSL